MPSPEDTGFFSISEHDIVAADKKAGKIRRKKKHTGRNIVIVILILLIILVGVAGYGYYQGYGWPTQDTVVEELFAAKSDNVDVGEYLAGTVSTDERAQIESILPTDATVAVTSIDRSMYASTVKVAVTLSAGGTQDYVVQMVRDGLGWKVSDVELSFASTGGTTSSSTTSSSASTDSSSTDSSTSTDASTAGTGAATTTS
jgi:hypothetical protein